MIIGNHHDELSPTTIRITPRPPNNPGVERTIFAPRTVTTDNATSYKQSQSLNA